MLFCKAQKDFKYPETGFHYHYFSTEFPYMHTHDYWEFFIVLSGSIMHCYNGETAKISYGDVFLVHPEDAHSTPAPYEKNYMQLNIAASDEAFRSVCAVADENLYDTIRKRRGVLHLRLPQPSFMEKINSEITFLQTQPNIETARFTTLMRLVWVDIIALTYHNLMVQSSESPVWLTDFCLKLRQPQNITLPIDRLYALTNYSHSHLTRLFKQYTGKTMQEYVTEIRLNYAANLLQTSDLTVLEVSYAIGFNSLSHFNRIFRAYFDCSPSEYRKR